MTPSAEVICADAQICRSRVRSAAKPAKSIVDEKAPTEDIFVDEEILNVSKDGSKIVEFYKDKCVFVTGATGFLGKILVEKLLRACEDVQTVYILIRDKKGKDIHTRMDEIYGDVVSESRFGNDESWRFTFCLTVFLILGIEVFRAIKVNKNQLTTFRLIRFIQYHGIIMSSLNCFR